MSVAVAQATEKHNTKVASANIKNLVIPAGKLESRAMRMVCATCFEA
jgi:hypothetical protein